MPHEDTPDDASNDSNSSAEHAPQNTGERSSENQNQTPPPSSPASDTDSQARMMAALAHGLGIIAPIAVPLIIWVVKRDELPQIDRPCKEALNFQITWCLVLILIATPTTCIPFFGCLGLPFIGLLGLGVIILQIIATIAESEGKNYRYPINIRIV